MLCGFDSTWRLTVAPTRQFRKKMAAGRHVKDDKNGARLYARNFFFLLNCLTYTISLGLTINTNITDKLHMVLDLPRLATCGSRSKSSHNMQYFTEKFHTKNSTRLNACNKWTLQSFYHKIIKAKQRKLYKRKKIWELITAWCYWRERFSLVSTAGFSSTLLSQFPYSWIMLPDRFFFKLTQCF